MARPRGSTGDASGHVTVCPGLGETRGPRGLGVNEASGRGAAASISVLLLPMCYTGISGCLRNRC
jgi:hypothetical protein